jgi:hypothetical protein
MSAITVHPIPELSGNEVEKSRLYYSKDEMNSISVEAKAMMLKVSKELSKSGALPCRASIEKQGYIVGLTEDSSLRGLELHFCHTRVVNKVLAMKAIMKYQNTLKSDCTKSNQERMLSLALAITKLSQWSKSVAVETARLDSIRSYGEDYLIPISEPVDITPFPAVKRRRLVSRDHEYNQDRLLNGAVIPV